MIRLDIGLLPKKVDKIMDECRSSTQEGCTIFILVSRLLQRRQRDVFFLARISWLSMFLR